MDTKGLRMRLTALSLMLGAPVFAQDRRQPDLDSRTQELRLMSYNLQNLFDLVDRPDTQDEEFLPTGKQKWTQVVLNDKFKNLGAIVAAESPDILGVTEVENQAILEEWVRSSLKGQRYQSVLAGPSDDARGITNGIISRFPVVETQSHRVWNSSWRRENGQVQTTRDILEVTLDTQVPGLQDSKITVFVNHWPSRAGGPAREFMRIEAGKKLGELMRQRLKEFPSRTILALGDFNDELSDRSMTEGLSVSARIEDLVTQPLAVFATGFEMLGLPLEKRGTYYFKKENQWNEIDHIVVGQGEQLGRSEIRGWRYRPASIRRVDHAFVRGGLKEPLGCELDDRAYAPKGKAANDARCLYGASDHYPLAAKLWLR